MKYLSASESTVIYSTEPLWGTAFAGEGGIMIDTGAIATIRTMCHCHSYDVTSACHTYDDMS